MVDDDNAGQIVWDEELFGLPSNHYEPDTPDTISTDEIEFADPPF